MKEWQRTIVLTFLLITALSVIWWLQTGYEQSLIETLN